MPHLNQLTNIGLSQELLVAEQRQVLDLVERDKSVLDLSHQLMGFRDQRSSGQKRLELARITSVQGFYLDCKCRFVMIR
jgi:hypothetical protein